MDLSADDLVMASLGGLAGFRILTLGVTEPSLAAAASMANVQLVGV